MSRKKRITKRIFVIDTNVLMHDPSAIFRFEEHDLYIPMMVLEELDRNKKGTSEQARNARQASRFLDELVAGMNKREIERGLALPTARAPKGGKKPPCGRLLFQTQGIRVQLPDSLPTNGADNAILACTLAIQQDNPSTRVTLVSKDINMRIKAAIVGVQAEDFSNDKTIDDTDVLYKGFEELPSTFWDIVGSGPESWKKHGETFYRIAVSTLTRDWKPNQLVYMSEKDGFEATVHSIEGESVVLKTTTNYAAYGKHVWGISPRNRGQNFALNLLCDKDIHLVTLLGPAGTGKTLLTLAAGLHQILEKKVYTEIIMTRVTIPLGEDIGFLPGNEEEKMQPWMGALMDNLEVLTETQEGGAWGRGATNDFLKNRIKIRSLNFMRGRTFLNRYIIMDEAQNLTAKQMKALVTRAGPGTKIVCLGNISQIDSPYLSETTSGLTYLVNRFQNWPHYGHIILTQGERSPLADYANEVM